MISLRNYQTDIVNKSRDALQRGVKRFIIAVSTGAGKSRTACHMIESAVAKGNTCIVLVNRDRLIKQWDSVMDELGIDHGIIQQNVISGDHQVYIASVDSYVSRLDKHFSIVFSDECHWALGDNYRTCIEHQNGISIGLTATPMKMNGDGFECLYDEIIQGIPMDALQELGYLSTLDIYSPSPPDVDLEVIDGDFNQSQYMRKCGGASRLDNAVDLYKKLIPNKRTIVFAVNIADSKAIAKRFNESGILSKCIHSKQSAKTQDKIMADFTADQFKVLVSVNILSEGADFPWLEAGIDLAPTASLPRYLQKWGRLLRTYPGKEKAVMLDLCGNYWIHKEPWIKHEWSLKGRKPTKKSLEESILSVAVCMSCGRSFDSKKEFCPYCGSGKEHCKRAIKEATGDLVLVTEQEHTEIMAERQAEQERKEKEEIKAKEKTEELKRRKKLAKTYEQYLQIEHDLGLKTGWGYINYNIYRKYIDRFR